MPLTNADFTENAKPLAQALVLENAARIRAEQEVRKLREALREVRSLALRGPADPWDRIDAINRVAALAAAGDTGAATTGGASPCRCVLPFNGTGADWDESNCPTHGPEGGEGG